MILDKSKLVYMKNLYGYDVSKTEDPEKIERVWLAIAPIEQRYIVKRSYKENSETIYTDEKQFPLTADGFSKATDYFEELIAKQTKKENENPDASNNAPPIGFLQILDQSVVSVEMQDGRKAKFTKNAYTIKSNIFTILEDFNDFEKNEKYYLDVIGTNPKIMGLYPVGDLENGDGSTSQKIDQEDIDDISEGKDPFDQKPSNEKGTPSDEKGEPSDEEGTPSDKEGTPSDKEGTPSDEEGTPSDEEGTPSHAERTPSDAERRPSDSSEDHRRGSGEVIHSNRDETEGQGVEKEIPTSREILANSYGVSDFNSLVDLFGDKETLLENLLSMDDIEKSGFMTKLGENFKSNSQFENVMRRIIL